MISALNHPSDISSRKTPARKVASPLRAVDPTEPAGNLPEILLITTYPPRECGIATYSQDLMNAINEKFSLSFSLKVCALESSPLARPYPAEVKYVLPTTQLGAYEELAAKLNRDTNLSMVFVQHEFGLYGGDLGQYLLGLLAFLNKPVITTFHTILPQPDRIRKKTVQAIAANSISVVAMTTNGALILQDQYGIPAEKITIIPHGTHLVSSFDHTKKEARHHLGNRMVLTTFGLLSPGKSIETALDALPAIVGEFPNVLYLIIGKTHPGVVMNEGERYRDGLQQKVLDLNLQGYVRFINRYLTLPDLLGYLQRTNIYLFTSKDPLQAVSGTFAYAMGSGCPIISTPIPHATELLEGAGVIVDFQQPDQLAEATIKLLADPERMHEMKLNALHKIRPTAWPNSALAHVNLIMKQGDTDNIHLRYNLPPITLSHIKKLTTHTGIIQFGKLSAPLIESGYTLDDNARALIAVCQHYCATHDGADLTLIEVYLEFILYCQQEDGSFLNYVEADGAFHAKNHHENLQDSNGRAIWALGEFVAHGAIFSPTWAKKAEAALLKALPRSLNMKSPRAISFMLKGLHPYHLATKAAPIHQMIVHLAEDLVARYRGVSRKNWLWFEDYLTYANGVMPEALLCAYLSTGNTTFRDVAKTSLDFLTSIIFRHDEIRVVSNVGWLQKGETAHPYGEQPIDVAYSILALDRFHRVFPAAGYRQKMEIGFQWFLGKNHLQQIMYNPTTGGCYDGLEENHINLNQGAESTVSYLLSRMAMEKTFSRTQVEQLAEVKN
ncbi:MAG: glycosyltransferase [Cyclobacteriaceae bacterium]|jgi:glycosyltransferase involved in cell wall biosynthesis|nr:glycosyltransferase [Cyclobacteriaceae bacterium]